MAVWQYKVSIVPKKEILKRFPAIPAYIDEEWFYSIDWEDLSFMYKLEIFFDTLLERSFDPRGAKNVMTWGTNNENEIGLVIEDNKISDVDVMIDTRKIDLSFIYPLVKFAEENELIFWQLETGKLIEPEIDTFLKSIKSSRANLFTVDPQRFFEDKKYLDYINKKNLRKLE